MDAARDEVFSQPVIGPINPATLVGEAECPRDFDFYTMTQQDLQKFEVEVEWTVAKVGLIHGVRLLKPGYPEGIADLLYDTRQIASWFDLSFMPPRDTEAVDTPDNEAAHAAWTNLPTPAEMASNQALYSYYGTGDNVLDPGELPDAPEDGWVVELPTGPMSQRTHWQQCRLLLAEPLAVNRNSTVHATITFTAHESRSYYIDLDMWVLPDEGYPVDERTRRKIRWNLAQQTLNYSYVEETVPGQQAWKQVTSAYS